MTEILPDERPQRRREYSGAGSTLGIAALIVILVGAGIWYFEFRNGTGGSGGTSSGNFGIIPLEDALNPTGKSPAAREGRAAPNFRLAEVGEEAPALTDYRGRWVLLNFWASWCGPCREETPDLQSFYEHNANKGFVILGVNQQEKKETARTFLEEFGVTYPAVLDSSGEVSQAYGVGRGMPISFLITPAGVVDRVIFGAISEEQFGEIEAKLP